MKILCFLLFLKCSTFYGQTISSEFDITNFRSDTIDWKDGVIYVYFYDKVTGVKRGNKTYNNGNLVEYYWIAPDELYSFAASLDYGCLIWSNSRINGISTTITMYYNNGNVKSIQFYNGEDKEDGWYFEFDENNNLVNKTFFKNGEKVFN